MPIRPENRHRYGKDWPEFSKRIRFGRAEGRCECAGECGRGTHEGRCPNMHGGEAYGTGSRVVLTVAHLCHTPECREHVKAMCQGCHLHYDREHHAETRRRTLERQRAADEAAWDAIARPPLEEAGVDEETITLLLHGRRGPRPVAPSEVGR